MGAGAAPGWAVPRAVSTPEHKLSKKDIVLFYLQAELQNTDLLVRLIEEHPHPWQAGKSQQLKVCPVFHV